MACRSLQGALLLCFPPKTLKTLASSATIFSCYHRYHAGNVTYTLIKNGRFGLRLFSSDLHGGVRSTARIGASAFSAASADDLRPELDENPEGIISGEWPENFSLLSYDDLRAYLETQIISEKMKPSALLGEIMSTPIRVVTADQTLEEIDHHFEIVSGLPVVDGELKCIGVISKKDKARALHGLKSKVGEVMSSPAIMLSPDKTVMDAAALMLKMKVHRIPILNQEQQVVGIVTRTDIFRALEAVEMHFLVRTDLLSCSPHWSSKRCSA